MLFSLSFISIIFNVSQTPLKKEHVLYHIKQQETCTLNVLYFPTILSITQFVRAPESPLPEHSPPSPVNSFTIVSTKG